MGSSLSCIIFSLLILSFSPASIPKAYLRDSTPKSHSQSTQNTELTQWLHSRHTFLYTNYLTTYC